MKIKHIGFSRKRINENPLEKKFAEAWDKQAPRTLGYIICGQDRNLHDFTQRDATVAASIIQWLGSPVGHNFVEEILQGDPHGKAE